MAHRPTQWAFGRLLHSTVARCSGMQVDLPWQRSRQYILVAPHPLLHGVTIRKSGFAAADATFNFAPTSPALASLCDYRLCGSCLLPPAALAEMAAAAAAACLADEQCRPGEVVLLRSVALSILVLLGTGSASAQSAPSISCTLSSSTGLAVLSSLTQGEPQQSMSCLIAQSRAPMAASSPSGSGSNGFPALTQLTAGAHQQQADTAGCLDLAADVVVQGAAKAADGFLAQPAVLESMMWECGLAGSPAATSECSVLTAAACMSLPLRASGHATSVVTAAGGQRRLHPAMSTTGSPVALEGMQLRPAKQMHAELAAAASLSLQGPSLYTLEWEAASSLTTRSPGRQAAPVLGRVLKARRLPRALQLEPLQLAQQAVLAGADVLEVLHSHRTVLGKTVALHVAGGLGGALQPGSDGQPNVGAAAIAGVLKNLPYELPFLSSQVVDAGANSCGLPPRAWALSDASLPPAWAADLYGVATGGGMLRRPRMAYSKPAAASGAPATGTPSMEPGPTYLVTGGSGGLGLLTANWMAGSGARSLVLLGRSGYAAISADAGVISSSLALVTLVKSDVGFSEDAKAALWAARGRDGRLGGIVHAAGVQVSLPCRDLRWAGPEAYQRWLPCDCRRLHLL